MANFVQLYKSTDVNMPPLYGASNSLIVLLNAVLVDGTGFTGVSISSITRAAAVATATVSAADGLRIKNGAILTISGATGADAGLYNGTFTVTKASATTFTYTMTGTPVGSPATGTIVCAATLPVTSLVESGTTITATLQVADTQLKTGQWVTISGASPSGANGVVQVTATDSTHFTYQAAAGLGTITGTVVYQRAPLGWARPFAAGTNSQTYRSADSTSNRFYLQVIDNALSLGGAKEGQVYGAEVMTTDQTVTSGQFPITVGGVCWRKSATADSTTERVYTIWGDDRTFFLVINSEVSGTQGHSFLGFGYFQPFKTGDGYNTFISGTAQFNIANPSFGVGGFGVWSSYTGAAANGSGASFARSYSQTGGAVTAGAVAGIVGAATTLGVAGMGNIPYPNGPDGALWIQPVFVTEYPASLCHMRGRLPGVYTHMHSVIPLNEYDLATNVVGLLGTTLTDVLITAASIPGGILIDTFGPW